MEGESDEEHVIDINDEEDEILDLYFRLVLELERSKTVVHYRKGKR